MTGGLKPYPEYRESGVPWAPLVPLHWKTERAQWLFAKVNRPARPEDEVVTCFRDGMVTLRKNRRLRGFTEAIFEFGYQGIRKGDLVIHAMDAFAGAIGVSDSDGKGTPVYVVCQPAPGICAHFYANIVREMARSEWILALARGIRERSTDFRYDAFRVQYLPVPGAEEQTAIVRFLSYTTKRLDHAIRAKRKLISLLSEQKQAVIDRTVTRGLDPNVQLKPSGLPWIGSIPAHWRPLQLRRFVSLVTSGSRGWARYYSDEGAVFLQSGNLGRSMALNLSFVQHVRPPEGSEGTRTKVTKNDLLLCITGALTGNVVLVDVDLPNAFVNQHVALIRPKADKAFPRFLAYALHSGMGQAQFRTSEYGGTKQGLGLGDVKSVVAALPPLREQEVIARHLDGVLADLTAPIAQAQREIELIREYRTRLIVELVTGQLDVRAAANNLPPEVQASESVIAPEAVDETEELQEAVADDE